MSSPITKHTIAHLAKLARLELTAHEEEALLKDLTKILAHFEELKELDTKDVAPLAGGTELRNIFREDTPGENEDSRAGFSLFPESHNDFLKIPPVFSSEE
jgi:aspartyl-tRNA(Asn)/glutamyl-tRNA(Gln) amidotransferase subunit C